MQITSLSFLKPISSFNRVLIFFVLLFSLPVAADTKVHLDEDIFLLVVNGKKVSKGHPLHKQNPITLQNGVNQLLVQFNVGIDDAEDDDDGLRYQRTAPSVLVFESQDQTLRLHAPQIESEADLDDFNKAPNWLLSGKNIKEIPLKVAVLEKGGVQIGRDFERELEKFNETQSPAALNYLARGPIIINAPYNPNARFAAVETDASVVQRSKQYSVTKEQNAPAVSIDWLLYLYKQASPNVQEQFKRIITQ